MRRRTFSTARTALRHTNCLYGAQVLHSEDMAAAFCRATNDWLRTDWLDRDERLRASIVVAVHDTDRTDEIDRLASDPRFAGSAARFPGG